MQPTVMYTEQQSTWSLGLLTELASLVSGVIGVAESRW